MNKISLPIDIEVATGSFLEIKTHIAQLFIYCTSHSSLMTVLRKEDIWISTNCTQFLAALTAYMDGNTQQINLDK